MTNQNSDYRSAIAFYDVIVHGEHSENTIENAYTQKHAEELVYCFLNKKDILDFDMWTHYETLLDETLSFDEYLALDADFSGDILELSENDTDVLDTFKHQLISLRQAQTETKKEVIPFVSVLRPGDPVLQEISASELKAGDTVFKNPFQAFTLTADCQQDPGGDFVISSEGSKISCSGLCSDLSGSIQEVPCTLESADETRFNGTVLVNTYTGLLYRPAFPSLSVDAFLSLMQEVGTKATLTIHERAVPIYYDGNKDLYALPHDLRPRPSLQELLNKADTRSAQSSQRTCMLPEGHTH